MQHDFSRIRPFQTDCSDWFLPAEGKTALFIPPCYITCLLTGSFSIKALCEEAGVSKSLSPMELKPEMWRAHMKGQAHDIYLMNKHIICPPCWKQRLIWIYWALTPWDIV